MGATAFHRFILTLGFLSLFHAAYSAAQRTYTHNKLAKSQWIFYRSLVFTIK